MLTAFDPPRSKKILVEKYQTLLAQLIEKVAAPQQAEGKQEEDHISYFKNIECDKLSNAALEAGVSSLKNLTEFKEACSKQLRDDANASENQAVFQQALSLGQHLFNKAQEDIKPYNLTPAHAQLLAFNHTLKAAAELMHKPNNHQLGKKLDRSLKTFKRAIDEDSSPVTHRLLYGFIGALFIFLGLAICASTLSLLLADSLTFTGIGSLASLVLGGISGSLISSGIHFLRMAFPKRVAQTPQQLELVDCANTFVQSLRQWAKNPLLFFKPPRAQTPAIQKPVKVSTVSCRE